MLVISVMITLSSFNQIMTSNVSSSYWIVCYFKRIMAFIINQILRHKKFVHFMDKAIQDNHLEWLSAKCRLEMSYLLTVATFGAIKFIIHN